MGDPEGACRAIGDLISDSEQDLAIRLSACLLYAYANLPLGNINRSKFALAELSDVFAASSSTPSPQVKAAMAFVGYVSSVLPHIPLPEDAPSINELLPQLPLGIRKFALYVQAHLLYLQGDYARSLGVAETTLLFTAETYPIPDEFTMSIWSYGTDSIDISDDFALEGASRRVVIRAERSLLHVTDNGDPVTGLEEVTATASDGTEYPAEEWLDGSHVGYYRFAKDLPAGTYSVSFGSGYETADAARLEVSEDGSSVFEMSFHSVKVEDVDHAHTWLIEPSTGERVSSLAHVLESAQVEIGTEVDDPYRFVAYEAEGTAPEWEDGDASKAGQTIAVRGDTTITATVAEESPESPDPGSEGSGSDNPAPENPDPEKLVSDKPAPEKLNSGKSNSSCLPVTGDHAGAMLVIAVAAVGFAAVLLASRVRGQ